MFILADFRQQRSDISEPKYMCRGIRNGVSPDDDDDDDNNNNNNNNNIIIIIIIRIGNTTT